MNILWLQYNIVIMGLKFQEQLMRRENMNRHFLFDSHLFASDVSQNFYTTDTLKPKEHGKSRRVK